MRSAKPELTTMLFRPNTGLSLSTKTCPPAALFVVSGFSKKPLTTDVLTAELTAEATAELTALSGSFVAPNPPTGAITASLP
jgi:hypothetical protein